MRSNFLLILFAFYTLFLSGQNSAVKNTDQYKVLINERLHNNALIKKQHDSLSLVGGKITAYYLKNKLVLITSNQGGPFGYVNYSFYIKNDSLVFVNEKKVTLKEPVTEKEYAEYERYVMFNTDKSGTTDLKKWPLTLDLSNDYYFQNRKIIKYQQQNFGTTLKTTENELEEVCKDLLYRYTMHQSELKE